VFGFYFCQVFKGSRRFSAADRHFVAIGKPHHFMISKTNFGDIGFIYQVAPVNSCKHSLRKPVLTPHQYLAYYQRRLVSKKNFTIIIQRFNPYDLLCRNIVNAFLRSKNYLHKLFFKKKLISINYQKPVTASGCSDKTRTGEYSLFASPQFHLRFYPGDTPIKIPPNKAS
jgi:hypothetical protein